MLIELFLQSLSVKNHSLDDWGDHDPLPLPVATSMDLKRHLIAWSGVRACVIADTVSTCVVSTLNVISLCDYKRCFILSVVTVA